MLSNPKVNDIVVSFNIAAPSGAIPWGAVNGAVYLRSTGRGLITKIGLHVTTQSGNICVGVFRSTGIGRARVPDARAATSGAVACPTVGYAEISLGASVYVTEDDYLAMSCDNTTAAFQGASGNNSTLLSGLSYSQATAHVLPANAASLTPTSFRLPHLVGVE